MKSDVPEILLELGKAIRKIGLAVSYILSSESKGFLTSDGR